MLSVYSMLTSYHHGVCLYYVDLLSQCVFDMLRSSETRFS